MEQSFFTILKDHCAASAELDFLASLRLNMEGERRVGKKIKLSIEAKFDG